MYILVLRARRFFEVVFEGQPGGVALVTRMDDVYKRRGVCGTMVFLQIMQNFKILSLGKYLFFTRDPNYKYCNCIIV